MSLLVYSFNPYSEGALALKEALLIKRIKSEKSKFKGHPRKTVINWGSSDLSDEINKCNVLNYSDCVSEAVNKLLFFRKMAPYDLTPAFTEDFQTATEWCAKGDFVVARTILTGHSGRGIVIMHRDKPNEFVKAPLYTKYIKKMEEYRIHIAFNEVIDMQKKVLSKEKAEGKEEINWKIRNLENGFIFQRENINPPECVKEVALKALLISELAFGAVDVVYNQKEDRAYVLEINTAPGLQGTTIENYANAFRRFK